MEQQHYDAIIIGSGQGGNPLASALATAGRRTALIEREHVGGTCINEGCTPTTTMIASARVAYLARRGADYGVRTDDVTIDMERVRQRKRDVVTSFREGGENRLKSNGVDLLMGEATFTGPRTVEVRLNTGGTQRLDADTIVINTGGRPAMPSIDGLEASGATVLNSTTIMELDEVPEHLVVLGGSYVGLEFGQMFCRFGSKVTIVERGPRLISREDADVSDAIAEIMRQDGLELIFEAQPLRASRGSSAGEFQLVLKTPGGEQSLLGSHLLAAAGRLPNTEVLNLAPAGVETDDRGNVKVNDRLETSVPGIYAIGDVAGNPQFTHISYDDFRILQANLLGDGKASRSGRLVPYTLFTDPQLGRVGLGEDEARRQGRNVKVAKIPMNYVPRALEVDESRGLMKAVVDADSGEILGCAVLGIEGGELMAMFEIAMLGHLPYTTLRDAIFAHPTLAESLNTLFASLDS
jgi:pyruvate/2-oxoglutarate dehydrogenase complex dihydrolipoamide dehydrogenase (E3) component